MARWPLNVHGTDSNRGGRARVQRRLRRDMSCVCDREAKIVNFQQKHRQASRDAWICFWQDGHNRGGVVSFRPLMADDCVNYSRAGGKVVICSYTRTFVAQHSPTANSFPKLSTFPNPHSISSGKGPKRYDGVINSKSVTLQGWNTIQVFIGNLFFSRHSSFLEFHWFRSTLNLGLLDNWELLSSLNTLKMKQSDHFSKIL